MPHTIHLTDASGKPAVQTVTIRTAKAKEVGLFFRGLGLAVSRQTGVDGRSLLTAKCTGLTLMIVPDQQPSDPNETTLNFAVDSLNSALDAATSNHGQLAMKAFETQWGRRAIVADPDGRRLVITELRPEVEPEEDYALPSYGDEPRISRSSRSKREENEAKALAALKRGVFVILLGMIVQFVGVLAIVATTIYTIANYRGSRTAAKFALGDQMELLGSLVGIAFLAQIGGKIMCGIPATSRASYVPLWSAVGLEVTNLVLGIVSLLDPNSGLLIPSTIVKVLGIAAPFLFVLFIANLMEESRNDALAEFAQTTNSVYGIMLVGGIVGLAFFFFMPRFALIASLFIGLLTLIYVGFYITLLAKLLSANVSTKGMR